MWIMTPRGFYSVVEHRESPGIYVVRTRSKADMENLTELLERRVKVFSKQHSDYPHRCFLTWSEWSGCLERMSREIDYTNFKDEVKKSQGWARSRTYTDVWWTLHGIEDEDAPPKLEWETELSELEDVRWSELRDEVREMT